MPMFHVILGQVGPEWRLGRPLEDQTGWAEHAEFMDGLVGDGFIVLGGPLPNRRVAHAVQASSEDEIRERFAEDPWSGSHLVVELIEPWTIRLDGRAVAETNRPGPADT
jgi:hypothetical protein